MEPNRLRRRYLLRLATAITFFMVCVGLEVVTVGVGIAYAAIDEEMTSIIIQAIATGEAVLLAIIFTVIFYQSIFWFNKIHKIENSEKMAKKRRNLQPLGIKVEVKSVRQLHSSDAAVGMQPVSILEQPTDETDTVFMMVEEDNTDNSDDTVYLLDHVGKNMIKPLSSDHLRPLSPSMTMLLLLSALFILMGLMALIWGITLSYDFGFGDENVIWPFIIVELIVGLICPTLLYIGVVLFAVVMDFVTQGRIDARKAVHSVLPSVELVIGSKNEYWSIKNTFYFFIRKRPTEKRSSSCLSFFEFSRATFYFVIIIGLSFGVTTSYFMNRTIVEQVNTRECMEDLHFDCFVRKDNGDWNYVNCSDNDTLAQYSFIHCYTFLRFGVDNNPIASLAESFAFYLAMVAFFGQAFGVVKILLRLRPSRLWGIWFIVIGLIIMGVAIYLMVSQEAALSIHRDVIGCFQILMMGLFLVVVGALLVEAGLWEREMIGEHKPIELRLFKPGHRHDLDSATSDKHTDTAV